MHAKLALIELLLVNGIDQVSAPAGPGSAIEEGKSALKIGNPTSIAPDTNFAGSGTAHLTMSNQHSTPNTGAALPHRNGDGKAVSIIDRTPAVGYTSPVPSGSSGPIGAQASESTNGDGHEPHTVTSLAGAGAAPEVDGASQPTTPVGGMVGDHLTGDITLAPTFNPHPTLVPYKAFDWKNEDIEIYQYTAWWKNKLLFEVGYLKTPQGVQTSIRRVLPERGGYSSSLMGVVRPLYRVRTVARLGKILFVESEPGADELNRGIARLGLGEEMIATTTAGGPGQSHKSQFTRVVRGQEIFLTGKEVFVLVGNAPGGEALADEIGRACAPHARSVRRVELPDLALAQTQEHYFRTMEDVGELLERLDDAPLWVDAPHTDISDGAPTT